MLIKISILFLLITKCQNCCVCERERERESWTAMIDTILRQTYSELCFFHGRFDTGPTSKTGGNHPRLVPKTTWHPLSWLLSTTDLRVETNTFFLLAQFTWFIHPIHMAFLLPFVCLKTQVHILFWNPQLTWPVKGQWVTLSYWLCAFKYVTV